MRKFVLSSAILAIAAVSMSQGSFTIVKPFDGSTVREIINVTMPGKSIPDAGYVGVFIDGKFIEAVFPALNPKSNLYEYSLDTKALEDGSHKLELKLFVDYSSQPRVIDTSSVDIRVSNRDSIKVPEDGIKMGYRFSPGTERTYRLQFKQVISSISEQDQKKGSRAFQMDRDGESLKLLFAVDNAYANGDGLMRMQVVPDQGFRSREFAYITTSSNPEAPAMHFREEMSPIYMRMTSAGREVWGNRPSYFGMDGSSAAASSTLLLASFPLPVLPPKAVTPGATWPTKILQGAIDLAAGANAKSVVVSEIDAAGEFIRVEWEMGHPCAVVRNKIAEGSRASAGSISDGKRQVEETFWFALDTKTVIKVFRESITEGKVAGSPFTLGGGGQNAPSRGGAPRSGAPGGKAGPGGANPDDFSLKEPFRQQGGGLSLPGGGRNKGQGGAPPSGGSRGGAGQGPPGGGAPGAGAGAQQNSFVRVRTQTIMVLEK